MTNEIDPTPSEGHSWPPPPQWLQTVIVLMALVWGTLEVTVLGARAASFAFILSVLTLSVGARVLATARGILR